MAGLTEREIGARVGVSNATVNRDIKKVLSDLAVQNSDLVNKTRALQLLRYERLMLPHWETFVGTENHSPTPEQRAKAFDALMKIMSRIDAISGFN